MEIKNNPNWNPSRDLYAGDIPPANNALVANLLQALLNSGRVEDMKATSQNLEGINPMQDVALGGTPMLMGISRSAAARKLGQMLQMSKRDPRIQEMLDVIPKPMMDKVQGMSGNFDRLSNSPTTFPPLLSRNKRDWKSGNIEGYAINNKTIILNKQSPKPLNVLAHEVGHTQRYEAGSFPTAFDQVLEPYTPTFISNMNEFSAEVYRAALTGDVNFIKAASNFGPEYKKIVGSILSEVGHAQIKDAVGAMDAYRKRPLKNK